MRGLLRLAVGYLGANLQGALEYRVAFLSQAASMLINDAMWLTFWLAYFTRFPLVHGWGRTEVATMWAVVAVGLGIGATIAGNASRLAGLIAGGQIDFYLALPRPVLPHLLVSRMDLTAPGDVIFGLVVFALLGHPTAGQWLLFAVLGLTTACIAVSFTVIVHSLGFWLGNAEGVAGQLWGAFVGLSLYPPVIFRGPVKLLLFTVIPAGFISYLPVELLRRFTWPTFAALVAVAALMVALATAVFAAGLRRYESGNLVGMRE
jgi:ABC-2 type transport system permease protein